MAQQLASVKRTHILNICLDLWKFYSTLNMEILLEILWGYCVGTSTMVIIGVYWAYQNMSPREGGWSSK